MKDKLFIALAVDKIVRNKGWGPADTWSGEHYALLSQDIQKITGRKISESTIKRLFREKRSPSDFTNAQIRTRNVLAKYLGYSTWEQFKRENRLNGDRYDEDYEWDLPVEGTEKPRKWMIVAIILFTLLVLLLLLYELQII